MCLPWCLVELQGLYEVAVVGDFALFRIASLYLKARDRPKPAETLA